MVKKVMIYDNLVLTSFAGKPKSLAIPGHIIWRDVLSI
jgi:hypothetical protein